MKLIFIKRTNIYGQSVINGDSIKVIYSIFFIQNFFYPVYIVYRQIVIRIK